MPRFPFRTRARLLPSRAYLLAALLVFLGSALGPELARADFPPVSDAEWALSDIPGHANAPAVVLHEEAELKLMEYPREASSFLKVRVRMKILTEEGKSEGEVAIPHSAFFRLRDVKGRTVLPGGRTVALEDDAILEERTSRSLKTFTTKLVFPAVEAGAILDYSYTVRWDDIFYLEPWVFHNHIPTLHSEITYIKPPNMGLKPWGVQAGSPLQNETRSSPRGDRIRIWVENLPAIPDEDFSYPFIDLTTRFMMVPTIIQAAGDRLPLMDSWRSACELIASHYKDVQRKDRDAGKKAQELAQGATSQLDEIAVLHRFVSREIQTQWPPGIWVNSEEDRVDKVLADRQGTPILKALLLQSMLKAIRIDSDLVWAANRSEGLVDLNVANPQWFESALVRVEVDGADVFLDPSDSRSNAGYLASHYEGMPALVFHKTKPEVIELPRSGHDDHRRVATVALEVDDEGRLQGEGTLQLYGHQAHGYLDWKDTPEDTVVAWQEWLENRYGGFDVSEVEVEEDPTNLSLRVGWDLVQRDEDVLGDETSVTAGGPLAIEQIFTLPPEIRRTPVLLFSGRIDETHLTVRWNEDWEIDAPLVAVDYENSAGSFERRTEAGEHQVTIHRRFERPGHEYLGNEAYGALRDLYGEASKADAQSLVLVQY